MAEARRGLGRGLDSLFPGSPAPETDTDTATGAMPGVLSVPLDQIRPNPAQPRRYFDEESLDELAASISQVGVLQPLIVRPSPEGGYELIAGERRLRAAATAELDVVPVVVRTDEDPDGTTIATALIENVQREDLSPLEEAAGYEALLDEHGLTHEEVATAVGKSRSAITNSIRLLQLPAAIQRMVERGDLSAGHGRALLTVDDTSYMEHVAGRAASEDWSVRRLEEAVKARKGTPTKRRSRAKRPAEIVELETRLRDQLDTRVRIDYGDKKGTLQIGFSSLDDLESLYLRFFKE